MTIEGNESGSDGGGMSLQYSANVSLTRVLISNNHNTGSDMCAGGGLSVIYSDDLTLTDVTLSDNGWGSGAGLCAYDSEDMVLDNVAVVGNTASGGSGGGMQLSSSTLYFTNGIIADNSADGYYGGGLDMLGGWAYFTNVIVADNSAGHAGGGIYLTSTGLSLENVVIVGNRASVVGGGISAEWSNMLVTNVSITDNAAGTIGGGYYGSASGISSLVHTNSWNNSPDNYYGYPDPTGIDGNISAAPLYLDTSPADPLEWDLHLDPASPLVDTGDASLLDPDSSLSDIGAYGGPEAGMYDLDWDGYPIWWQPGPYDFGIYPGLGWDCDDLDAGVGPGSGC